VESVIDVMDEPGIYILIEEIFVVETLATDITNVKGIDEK